MAEDTVEKWKDHFKDLQNLVMFIFEEAESEDGKDGFIIKVQL